MLTKAQIEEYNDVGAIVVPNVLTPAEVRTLSEVTDGFVDRANRFRRTAARRAGCP